MNKKEFYFVRHGQTDHNLHRIYSDGTDISLNETGRAQALAIEPLIRTLPIKTICHSPMKRAIETKCLISASFKVLEVEIKELSECEGAIWKDMSLLNYTERVLNFMDMVKKGLEHALSHEGPILIVAHGGIHFAICSLLKVKAAWNIDNCIPSHFYLDDNNEWSTKRLILPA